jgi:hypothetical protein
MLPARTAGAIDIDLEILVLDADVHLVRFGQDGNGCGGSMDAPARFGNRHALHAVDAAFELQLGEDAAARDVGDRLPCSRPDRWR